MISSTSRSGRVISVEVSAEIGSTIYADGLVGKGHAVCRKEDHFVQGIGERIALGRAMQDLGAQLEAKWSALSVTQAAYVAQTVQSPALPGWNDWQDARLQLTLDGTYKLPAHQHAVPPMVPPMPGLGPWFFPWRNSWGAW